MTLSLCIVLLLGVVTFAVLEWTDPKPCAWVVKVRLWLNRRKP